MARSGPNVATAAMGGSEHTKRGRDMDIHKYKQVIHTGIDGDPA